jgi:hypothetical protein
VGNERMTSRERALAVLKGLPVDRVPVLYWLNPHATCRMMAEVQPARNRAANWMARRLWRRFKRQGELKAGEWTRAWPLLFEEYGNGQYALDLGADVSIRSPEYTSPTAFATSIRKRNGRLTFRGPFDITMGLGGVYAYPIEPAIIDARDLGKIRFPPTRGCPVRRSEEIPQSTSGRVRRGRSFLLPAGALRLHPGDGILHAGPV